MEIPTIVIDKAEPNDSEEGRVNGDPLRFNAPTKVENLYTGDYSIAGLEHLFAVERKTIADLVGSVTTNRARFERELTRLRGMEFGRLLIIGKKSDINNHNYRSKTKPVSVNHSLRAFSARYPTVAIQFVDDKEQAVALIEEWAKWFAREILIRHKSLLKGSPQLVQTKEKRGK